MPAPINYAQGFTNPMDSIMQTLQLGNALGQMGQIRDQRAAAQQAAEAKDARDAEIQAAELLYQKMRKLNKRGK